MRQPPVNVTEISPSLDGEESLEHTLVRLGGDNSFDFKFNELLARIKDSSEHAYILRW